MKSGTFKLFFDDNDYKLLNIVNEVLNKSESFDDLGELLYPYLHPNGIKELAESKGLRIAYAIIRLMESLEGDKSNERLKALQSLRDEVLNSAESHMQKNTGRILLQIMKELVRTRGDHERQLELAHDFRSAVSGRPRVIRRLLREYHLLEMPEEWNQITFDGHVHDSYTKGRKSPSHLIMDAWIKGIRYLTVIYHNYVDLAPAVELLKASEIMEVDIRIGVEFPAKFQDKYVQLIWVPRGFTDAQDFITFLSESRIVNFMEEGRKTAEYHQEYILSVLGDFNENGRIQINERFGLQSQPLAPSDFLSFNKISQPSILQLAKFIHTRMLPILETRVEDLRSTFSEAAPEQRHQIVNLVAEINALDPEAIAERFLRRELSPTITVAAIHRDGDIPGLLQLSPFALIDRLNLLRSGFRIILNLDGLKAVDVLELLYDCSGLIGYLEIFNLKDYINTKSPQYYEIGELQQCINEGSTFQLSRMIKKIVHAADSPIEHSPERMTKFNEILQNASALKDYYRRAPLKSSIGSDSAGYSRKFYGMGFAVKETLPRGAQRELNRKKPVRLDIPVRVMTISQTVFIPRYDLISRVLNKLLRILPGASILYRKRKGWRIDNPSTRITPDGNIVPLGGTSEGQGNGFLLEPGRSKRRRDWATSWRYLNGTLKNTIKISAGFIPSVLTFMYTQDWWFLIYLGTPIWFLITVLRNILQSVFGGGGIRRSPLLKWNSYVNWDRISDSLLYTGLSVPLLEYFVKVLILDQTFGVTTANNPVVLYSVMSIVNGVYIAGHNMLRGLPREAIVGNLFRSILNIPLSIGLNATIGALLGYCGVMAINDILQQWASIITKSSSDIVAGVIEGFADGLNNIRIRFQDYSAKLTQLYDIYEQLEIVYPEDDLLSLISSPSILVEQLKSKYASLRKIMIVNALDLLYLWMYKARSLDICSSLVGKMSFDELQVFMWTQTILRSEREITQLFADGLVGRSFSKPLAFYLGYYSEYLEELRDMVERRIKRTGTMWKITDHSNHGHSSQEKLHAAQSELTFNSLLSGYK
jgi:hypothetical protein